MIFEMMIIKKYESYSDQITLSRYIRDNITKKFQEEITLNNVKFTNNIIEVSGIRICVLDFNLITRDPVISGNQYGNHIHIDNCGSTKNFIKFFYNKVEELPSITQFY